jgi:hypothetical protein
MICTNAMAMDKLKHGEEICVQDDFYGVMNCEVTSKIEQDVYMADCHKTGSNRKWVGSYKVDKKTMFIKGECEENN